MRGMLHEDSRFAWDDRTRVLSACGTELHKRGALATHRVDAAAYSAHTESVLSAWNNDAKRARLRDTKVGKQATRVEPVELGPLEVKRGRLAHAGGR